jgi:hypothetical protein
MKKMHHAPHAAVLLLLLLLLLVMLPKHRTFSVFVFAAALLLLDDWRCARARTLWRARERVGKGSARRALAAHATPGPPHSSPLSPPHHTRKHTRTLPKRRDEAAKGGSRFRS